MNVIMTHVFTTCAGMFHSGTNTELFIDENCLKLSPLYPFEC